MQPIRRPEYRVAGRRRREALIIIIKLINSYFMEFNLDDLCSWAEEARRGVGREIEEMQDALEQQMKMHRALGAVGDLARENASLQEELSELKEQCAELEMNLAELGKLSADVAKKASHEELLKALRTYIIISRRKNLNKRSAVKIMILELASAVGLELPDDLKEAVDSLDDEQPEQVSQTVVNVGAGGINVQNANKVKK